LLLGVWCVAGYLIPRHPMIGNTLKRWGHWIVPLVLIGLGLHIILS